MLEDYCPYCGKYVIIDTFGTCSNCYEDTTDIIDEEE